MNKRYEWEKKIRNWIGFPATEGTYRVRRKQCMSDISKIIETLKLPMSNFNVRFQFKFALSYPPPFPVIFSSLWSTNYLLEYPAFILKLVFYVNLKELEGHMVNSCWNHLCWQPLRPFWKTSEGRCFPSCCSNTSVRWHYWSQTQQQVSHPALWVWTCSSKKHLNNNKNCSNWFLLIQTLFSW